MKYKITLLSSIIIFFSILSSSSLYSKIKSNIVVFVGNEIITNFEIKNKILTSLMLAKVELNQKNIDSYKKQALNSLIDLKLKKKELSKYNFRAEDSEVNKYINSISSNNIIEFKKNFSNNDLSFSLFVEEIKIELKWRKLIYEIFKGRVKSTEKSVEKELNEIIKKQSQIVEYKVSEIEIELQKDGNEIDQIKKIKKFINQIGFENTALKYSSSSSAEQKGDLGWVKENALSKPVREIIKDLEIGAVSKPIKKLNKITFLKLVDKKKVSIDPKNKEKIKNDLIAAKENDLFILYSSSYLSRLKNNTLIEYK